VLLVRASTCDKNNVVNSCCSRYDSNIASQNCEWYNCTLAGEDGALSVRQRPNNDSSRRDGTAKSARVLCDALGVDPWVEDSGMYNTEF
jgi:hypothetical protein